MEAKSLGQHLFCAGCGVILHETKHTVVGDKIKCTNCNRLMTRPAIAESIPIIVEKVSVKKVPVKKTVVKKAKKK